MAAGEFNMTGTHKVEAGTTWDFEIPFQDENGAAIDFVGLGYDEGRVVLRRDADDLNAVPAVIDIGTAPSAGFEGLEVKAGGILRVIIDAATSADASWVAGVPQTLNRSGVLSIEVYPAGNQATHSWRVADGVFELDPEGTRGDSDPNA